MSPDLTTVLSDVVREAVRAVLLEQGGIADGLRYLSLAQVADRLAVHPDTAAKILRERRIRGIRLGDSTAIRYRQTEIEAWLADEHKRQAPKTSRSNLRRLPTEAEAKVAR